MPLGHDEYVYRSPLSTLKNFPLWKSNKLSRYQELANGAVEASDRLTGKLDHELKELADQYHQEALNGRPLDSLIVPVFRAGARGGHPNPGLATLSVQIVGGIGLHKGHIVEMATGEGKTLVATCPAVLNSLTDQGVHVVTVNDYLAKRDQSKWAKSIRTSASARG